jgi:hypothetical protein
MKRKKYISFFTIAAFSIFTWSCTVYSTNKISPDQIAGKSGRGDQVLRVMKTSGEIIEFPEKIPGFIYNDAIVGSPGGPIPLSEVELIWIKEKDVVLSTAASLGVLAAVVGVTVLGIALIVWLTKGTSCPILYAQDDMGNFQREGELYSGAIFKEIKRTDYLKLHHLTEKNNSYTLKISNEADETQCTDVIKLLVVDHPKKTGVFVGSDGIVHTVRNPLRPLSAQDLKGADFTKALAASDNRMWSSNPVHKNPDNPEDLKSGIVLKFPKPPSAKKAKLVVRIGNTFWVDYLMARLFGLTGSMMESWYRQLAQRPQIREKAESFMRQQGFSMRVQSMKNGAWEDLGYFYPTGPIGMKDDILEFPLDKEASNPLTVRLDGGTFFWMVDYVGVDYSMDLPVEIHELAPIEAIDENGHDVKEFLALSDGSDFVMPEPGNFAVLKFSSLAKNPEAERSFILKSEGYYLIHSRKEGMPDYQTLLAIQQDPTYILKFSLQEFAKAMKSKAQPLQK